MVERVVTGERPDEVPFAAHIDVLHAFLIHREQIVEKLQGLLNAQQKPPQYLQEVARLRRQVEECFFTLAALTSDQSRLRGKLQQVHWSNGFHPRDMPGIHNDLVDPAEMMTRAFNMWQQTRWPGRNGRIRYAQSLFNLQLLRSLELLTMRLWDAGLDNASDRLAQIQGVLDQLWITSPADQPVLVRDARWLIPVAQSPTTDELAPYFEVAEKVAASLAEQDRIEIHKASVEMAGGHLRSQLRHFTMQGTSLDEKSLVLSSRGSNALDFAVTIQGLVSLLNAYERACRDGGRDNRRKLASAICQGISADPELFVNRVDLLGAYSMIEELFTTTAPDGSVVYTHMGQRHVGLVHEYAALMPRLAKQLYQDCPQFRPIRGTYSPYGVIFGFSTNLTEHMALKALQPDAVTRFSLEDVFADEDGDAGKLAWVNGWRKLPHISPEVLKLYEYPQQFAEAIFERIVQALHKQVENSDANAVVETGRLFVVHADEQDDAASSHVPELPAEYCLSSDATIVAAHKATSCTQSRLLHDRKEGMYLVSYQTAGGWIAISKDILTEFLAAGRDVKIVGLPDAAAAVLRLMYPQLISS